MTAVLPRLLSGGACHFLTLALLIPLVFGTDSVVVLVYLVLPTPSSAEEMGMRIGAESPESGFVDMSGGRVSASVSAIPMANPTTGTEFAFDCPKHCLLHQLGRLHRRPQGISSRR
jgi:hypothetical protein